MEILSNLEGYFVPSVVVFCLCAGYVLKNFFPTDNKWIPLTLFVIGAILGVIAGGFTLEAVVAGGVSGLASTGLNQAFKQALGLNVRSDIELTESDAIDEMITAMDDEDDSEDEDETDENMEA